MACLSCWCHLNRSLSGIHQKRKAGIDDPENGYQVPAMKKKGPTIPFANKDEQMLIADGRYEW